MLISDEMLFEFEFLIVLIRVFWVITSFFTDIFSRLGERFPVIFERLLEEFWLESFVSQGDCNFLQSLLSSGVVMFYGELSELKDSAHDRLFDFWSDPNDNLWSEVQHVDAGWVKAKLTKVE